MPASPRGACGPRYLQRPFQGPRGSRQLQSGLGLPDLEAEFGRETLLALSEPEEARYGYDAWGTYRTLLDLFPNEIQRTNWGIPCASEPIEFRAGIGY
jgi:hypothetical protein